MSAVLDTEVPRLKPSLRQRIDILLPEPLAFSSAFATPDSIGESPGVNGVPPIVADDDTSVGLEILKSPVRLVFFR